MDKEIRIQKDGRSFKGEPFCKRGHPKEFGKDCRECNRLRCLEWSRENAESQRAKHREYYQEHKEEMLANMREYCKIPEVRAANRARRKEWAAANREHLNAWSREHYKKIRHEHAIRVKSWKDRNREVWREINNAAKNRKRARISGSIGSHTRDEWNFIVAKQKGKCMLCGMKRNLQKDHIIPLSLGGSDMAVNLQGLCGPCNRAKSASISEGTQLGIFDRIAENARA